jgi:hypothetical protein
MLAVTRLGGARLEELFHPGERDTSPGRGALFPFAVTDLFSKSDPRADTQMEASRSQGV